MTREEKSKIYESAKKEIKAVLLGENYAITKMATINCILKQNLPSYYWVGFYLVHEGGLIVGPYQGTLGCIHIPFNKGVCGRAARMQTTQIVDNVHEDLEHVACDSRSNSEIVVPVFNGKSELIAVFDVDSTEFSSFDEIDKLYLEQIMTDHFIDENLQINL